MKVNREDFLQCLDSVAPGLSSREVIEQSSCFVFKDKMIHTFNEEISCSIKTTVSFEGAVQAKPLLSILKKLDEEHIDIEVTESELLIKGRNKRAGVAMEQKIVLPIDSIVLPTKWKKLDKDFAEAVHMAAGCASTDESQFSFTCVNITPEFVIACDNLQVARYMVKTDIKQSTLVKHNSIKHIVNLGMVKFSESENYLHFKNKNGLILSCRRYIEDYPDVSGLFDVKGSKIALPKGLEEAAEKGSIFSSENVDNDKITIDIKPGKITIKGTGSAGWYKEVKKTNYSGRPISFTIAPKMLQEIVKKHNECKIAPERLMVEAGKFTYITCLGVPEDA